MTSTNRYPACNARSITLTLSLVIVHGVFAGQVTTANGPGWSPVIVATGDYRQRIKSMPIEQRPYRPLHFYGNAVRRSYHRGGRNSTVYGGTPGGSGQLSFPLDRLRRINPVAAPQTSFFSRSR